MSNLHLTLLGPSEVRHGDQVLTFSTRKELALLIYLAVEGHIHSRQKLSELLWSESDAVHGRAALRITLLHLRTVLGEEAGPETVPHLLITRDTLSLDPASGIELDLHTLHAAWRLARASIHTAATMPEDARRSLLAQLQHATDLSRGEFLEGFSLRDAPTFDSWMRFQREYWHLHMHEVFDRLSQLQFEAGELGSAIATVSRWLVLAPLHEDAHRRLMRLHFAAGDRSAALQSYKACRALLATELQTEPTPETVALAERIRATVPPRRKLMRTSPLPRAQATLLDGSLLGRATELRTLIKLYHSTQRGQPQLVLLEGETGIGKTRLAKEFLAWAELEGADVLRGRAFESGARLPYQLLIGALRVRLEQENAPDDLLSDVWLAELARLLPELRERYPDLPDPLAEESVAKNLLFEAVARLGQGLAMRAPLVIFLDDMQWVDAASLDMLHYLVQSFAADATPALLLLAVRTEALGTLTRPAEWRAGLEHAVSVTRLQLGPLSFEDTLRLLQAWADKDGRSRAKLEHFGRWLFAETEGHPFYMMEMLKVLLDHGVLAAHLSEEGGWTIDVTADIDEVIARGDFFPPSVREVICARLDRLTPNAFALLVAAAVLGQWISFEYLCRVADLTEHDGLLALDEVLHNRLLQEARREEGHMRPGDYVFAHEKIRAVVYAEAGEARRRIFHRKALEVLQEVAAPTAQLAYHARAAGLWQAAFRLSVIAGDEAMQVFAVSDAISFYEQAQHLMPKRLHGLGLMNMLPSSEIEHVFLQLGRAYELSAEWEKAQLTYRELLAYARSAGELAMEDLSLNRLAMLDAQQSFEKRQN